MFINSERFTTLFLFQTGSIKSKRYHQSRERTQQCFYSKLVRLKEIRFRQLDVVFKSFYSKLVRLKGYEAAFCGAQPIYRFYSKLVRLKGKQPTLRLTPQPSFYSKLVRLKDRLLAGCPFTSVVSIPNWFD